MYKVLIFKCRVIILLIKSPVLPRPRCRCRRGLLKVSIKTSHRPLMFGLSAGSRVGFRINKTVEQSPFSRGTVAQGKSH